MPNEFQRVIDSRVGNLPVVDVYLDDTRATRGSAVRTWREVKKMMQVLNDNNAVLK